MEEKDVAAVPYIVHEGAMVKLERSNHRMMVAIIVIVIALVINNCAWLIFENHRQTETREQITQIIETEGNTNAN